MGLRYAQRGYRYQDFIAELVFCWSLFIYKNPTYIVDEKDNKNDWIEDIKVLSQNKKDCFQIKYSKKRRLSLDDFRKDGELSLPDLFSYYLSQKEFDCRFFLLLKWSTPTDELKDFLINDSYQIFDFNESAFLSFDVKKMANLCLQVGLPNEQEVISFLSKIHIVCEMPDASLDYYNPLPLENYLIEVIKRIGIGTFPNDCITPEQFAINLFAEMNNYRTGTVFTISALEILNRLAVCTDFGKLSETPSLNESVIVKPKLFINEVFESVLSFQKVIVTGEPGSGKTHFCYEFERFLREQHLIFAKHYLYVGTNDSELEKRTDANYLIGNLLSSIYDYFPNLKNDNPLFAADIDCLNKAIESIEESLLLIIDGVDHAYRNYNMNKRLDFIDLISNIRTNDHVHILVITQPMKDINKLVGYTFLSMPRWSAADISLLAKNKNIAVSDEQLRVIELKGEGNPLYITYLLENVANLDDAPNYGGDISNYYRYLIQKTDSPYLFKYLVSIPFSFSKDEFRSISNSGIEGDLFFDSILFLLKYDNLSRGYKVYHESLVRFLYDYCSEKNIDMKAAKRDVANYLRNLDFYEDLKAYNTYLYVLNEISDYSTILTYMSYSFLEKSVFFGHSITEINNNMKFFKIASCSLHDYYSYYAYLLLKRCVDNYADQDYVGGDYPDYYLAYLSLKKEDGLKRLLLHKSSPKVANLVYYSASLEKLNPPQSLLSSNADYSSFERNYYLASLVAEKYSEGGVIKGIKTEASFSEKVEIIRTLNELGKLDDLTENVDLEIDSVLNCYGFEGRGKSINSTFDLSFRPDFYKENYAKILATFVLYVNNNLLTEKVKEAVCHRQIGSFIFTLFRLIIDNHDSFARYNVDKDLTFFEKSLVENLVKFKNTIDPFVGKPRACDCTSLDFKYIFIVLLFSPLKYVKSHFNEYFKVILEIKDKLEVSFRGSVMSCLSLDDILDNIEPFLDGNNAEEILKSLESEIEKSSYYFNYIYSAGFCFKISRLFKNLSLSKQTDLYSKGVRYSLAYGNHKDIFFEEIVDSFKYHHDSIPNILDVSASIGNMAQSLDFHTDGRETKWFYIDWINAMCTLNIKGITNFITHDKINKGYFWKNDIGTGIIVENIYKKISSINLFWILITNQFELSHFDYDIYLYCLNALKKDGNDEYASQLINYLFSISGEFDSDKELIKQLNLFLKESTNNEMRFLTREERENGSIIELENENSLSSAMNYGEEKRSELEIAKLIIKNEPLDNSKKKELVAGLIYDNRLIFNFEEFGKVLFEHHWSNDDYSFLKAVCFYFNRDGWFKSFIDTDSFVDGRSVNENIFDSTFFHLAKMYDNVWRGASGIGNAICLFDKSASKAVQFFNFVYNLTLKRLPDCKQIVNKELLSNHSTLEKVSLSLLLSNINDYGTLNHKSLLRFIDEAASKNNTLVIKWLFLNWNSLCLFVKFELLALFIKNHLDFTIFSSEIIKLSKRDTTYLTRTFFGGVVAKINPIDFEPNISFFSEKNAEYFYCYLHLFNFRIVSDFCFWNKLDCSDILKLYKKRIMSQEAKDEYKMFYSPASMRPVENHYRYNLFLECVNAFFEERIKDLSRESLFGLIFKLLPLEENLTTNFYKECENSKNDYVLIGQYDSSEIFDSLSTPRNNLLSKKEVHLEHSFLSDDQPLSIDNLEKITGSLCYDYQLLIGLSFEIVDKYSLIEKESNGITYYYFKDSVIGFYQTKKNNIKGIENYSDRYYLNEQGFLYIKKSFLKRICKDYGVKTIKKCKSNETIDFDL